MIYVIAGKGGAGKDTILKDVAKQLGENVQIVVTSTSRPPRDGEVDGVDYHFETTEYFENNMHKFICVDKYIVEPHGLCYYGVDLEKMKKSKTKQAVVLSPSGARELKKKYGDQVKIIYIMATRKVRGERYLKRENYSAFAKERVARRIEADDLDFDEFEFEVDFIVMNNTDHIEDAVIETLSIIEAESHDFYI